MTGPRGRDLAAPDLLGAARACYGGLLLAAPRRMAGVCASGPAGSGALAVVRVLGGRHLLQAALTAAALSARIPSAGLAPGPVLLAGAAADTAHAASMTGLALAGRPLRRAAAADAVLEAGFAAFGILTARHLRSAGNGRPGARGGAGRRPDPAAVPAGPAR